MATSPWPDAQPTLHSAGTDDKTLDSLGILTIGCKSRPGLNHHVVWPTLVSTLGPLSERCRLATTTRHNSPIRHPRRRCSRPPPSRHSTQHDSQNSTSSIRFLFVCPPARSSALLQLASSLLRPASDTHFILATARKGHVILFFLAHARVRATLCHSTVHDDDLGFLKENRVCPVSARLVTHRAFFSLFPLPSQTPSPWQTAREGKKRAWEYFGQQVRNRKSKGRKGPCCDPCPPPFLSVWSFF